MKYTSYEITYFNERKDGRVEPAGRERKVLSREEAIALSDRAAVEVLNGLQHTGIFIVKGENLFVGDRGEVLS